MKFLITCHCGVAPRDIAVSPDKLCKSYSVNARTLYGPARQLGKFRRYGRTEAYEVLAYRSADIRYGIGKQYVRNWETEQNLNALLINPLSGYSRQIEGKENKKKKNTTKTEDPVVPSLCFVGRQEKWKGPDLFLELCPDYPGIFLTRY
ncbi:MAG: hypothetical protein IPP88_22410 [Betaproteobacteria bacterium]|nr:hypothetical protein [Betaproteobacteria bacterium]